MTLEQMESGRIVVEVFEQADGFFNATANIQVHGTVWVKLLSCVSRKRELAISYALTEAAVAFARDEVKL